MAESETGEPRGVTAQIAGADPAERFGGAAVLRTRPHPQDRVPALQLGVPDDALGFRPRPGAVYRVTIADDGASYISRAVWLERVQSSWWFVLERDEGAGRSD